MPLIVSAGKSFDPAPAGVCDAVCVDVVEHKNVKTKFGLKTKIQITWEIQHKRKDGKPFIISRWYNKTLDSKGTLRPDLASWRGRDFTEGELVGFDLEKVLGAPCMLNIVHTNKDGKTFANVAAIMKAGANKLKPSGEYVRKIDRPDYKPEEEAKTDHIGHEESMEELEKLPECPF